MLQLHYRDYAQLNEPELEKYILYRQVNGQNFFKVDAGRNVTVNFPASNARSILVDMWFQQDGSTLHTIHPTMNLMKNEFAGQVISRFGPFDYFLWKYVISLSDSIDKSLGSQH